MPMRYAGNLSESESAHYKDRKFTHSHRGVNYYDCWTHEDEHRPAFKEEKLQKWKIRGTDSIFNTDLNGSLGETLDLDDED